ncbi:MAG TPA: hypothetical protein DCS93_42860 [Microscillaceae bacterium]|nr:hypothetical protein [Microscillaceae bacterium]
MDATLFLIFSHELTQEQVDDATQRQNVTKFVPLPEPLQELWKNIPPELDSLEAYLAPIVAWINKHCKANEDLVLIQGDFGATYFLVNHCLIHHYARPVYATTERQVVEEQQKDGTVITKRVFKHKKFRKYHR